MTERIRITRQDNGVAEVALVRSDKMNALDPAMFDALAVATQQLKADTGLRAVVLHGQGKAFCAGLDMASMAGLQGSQEGAAARLLERSFGIANLAQIVALAKPGRSKKRR